MNLFKAIKTYFFQPVLGVIFIFSALGCALFLISDIKSSELGFLLSLTLTFFSFFLILKVRKSIKEDESYEDDELSSYPKLSVVN